MLNKARMDPKVLQALAKLADLTEHWEIGGAQPVKLSWDVEGVKASQVGPEVVLPRLAQVEACLAIKEKERPWPRVLADRKRHSKYESKEEYEENMCWKKPKRPLLTEDAKLCVEVLKGKYE